MPDDRPWLTPQVGDVCMSADGKHHRRVTRYQAERHPTAVYYMTETGRLTDCWITTWTDWCGRTVRAGGSYRRKENEG